ncbi:MAG: biotin--[acetyl-CoA-carboxylase] ligase [Eubacteriales bacterium]|nr:biotin--[acetyl-CoA-carboxylase] ligase [Eubacteriales bacterium]
MLKYKYDQQAIASAIKTKWAGKTVHFAKVTDSTNNWLKQLAKEGAPEGTIAIADYQSAGKGRLGRVWTAPPDTSATFSLLVRPTFAPEYASMMTLIMGLSVAQAVRELGLPAQIKWPNDAVVSRKKICGILTEMALAGNQIDYVVIGTGINVNIPEIIPELSDKATSFYLETGKEFDRCEVLALVLQYFEHNYEKYAQTCDLSEIREAYEELLANKGEPVRVLCEEPYEGICLGINDRGELLVEKEDGTVSCVNSGEVSVRGLYSYV